MAKVLTLYKKNRGSAGNLTENSVKRCSKCEEILPRSHFSKNSQAKDKLHWHCRPCNSAIQKAWAAKVKVVAPPKPPPAHINIVDEAKLVLRNNGWTHQKIEIAGLDRVMTEANRIRHDNGEPQLGRKAECLVK